MKLLLSFTLTFTSILCPVVFLNNLNTKPSSKQVRIFGGQDAIPHSAPWMIYIAVPNAGYCGGSIVNMEWIVTAAHCLDKKTSIKSLVTAGDHDLTMKDGTEQRRSIDKIIIHPDYEKSNEQTDIGLAHVSHPFTCNDFVDSIDLPAAGSTFTGTATFFGWGRLNEKFRATVLQTITLQIVDYRKCIDEYKTSAGTSELHLCAGSANGEGTICRGDSGSGLVQNGILIGIDISGGEFCDASSIRMPEIMIRVAAYTNWIKSIIG